MRKPLRNRIFSFFVFVAVASAVIFLPLILANSDGGGDPSPLNETETVDDYVDEGADGGDEDDFLAEEDANSGEADKDLFEVIKPGNPMQTFETSKSTKKGLYVGTAETSPIRFRGGHAMARPIAVYPIYYGNWDGPTGSDTRVGTDLIKNFLAGYGVSPRFLLNPLYVNPSNSSDKPSSILSPRPAYFVPRSKTGGYLYGKSLSDYAVYKLVEYAVVHNSANWPKPFDPDGTYFVFTSSDVTETSGFCRNYCGWHTYDAFLGTHPNVKFSFVGNPSKCLSACSAQKTSPNGNPGVDAMINVIAHELDEMITDPLLNAWYDDEGEESADKCAWTWGKTNKLSSGAFYNLRFATPAGAKNYLVQQQWKVSVSGGKIAQKGCAMS
jgi:hypothetical protein